MFFLKNSRVCTLMALAILPLTAELVAAPSPRPGKTEQAAGTAPTHLALDGMPKVWLQGTPVACWEKDKVYVIEFWATWCGPCVAAMPHLEALHGGIMRENLNAQIIGVNVSDKTTPERLKKFLARQSVPPTYTIAVDTEKNAEQKWLRPLKVIGIPFALALKNGEIIWRGHPQSLSGDLIRKMTQPGFVAEAPKTEKAGKETPRVRQRVEEIARLFRSGKTAEAESLLNAFLEDATVADSSKIDALEAPCRAALLRKDYRRMNAYLRRKAEAFPTDFYNRYDTAYFILETDDVPVAARDLALAEECLNAAVRLAKSAKVTSRLPQIYTMLADIHADHGEHAAEKEARKRAWESTPEYKSMQRIREKITSPEARALYEALDNKKTLFPQEFDIPVKTSAPWKSVELVPSDSAETRSMLAFLNSLAWAQGEAPKMLPKNSVALIEFWMPPEPGPFSPHFNHAPGKWLERKLPEGYDLPVVVVALEQDPGRAKTVLSFPRYRTAFPVGVISADAFAKTVGADLGIEGVPATIALRDGKIIWKGATQDLPDWVLAEATQPEYDHVKAEAKQVKALNDFRIANASLMKVRRFIAEKKYALAKATLEEIRPITDSTPALDMRASEMLAAIAYLNHDYAEVGKICTALMNKYPNTDFIASMQAKLINSNQDMRAANLPVLILSARNMIGAGTPYTSEYWDVLANLYAETGDMRSAVYAIFRARETNKYWQLLTK